MWPFPDRRIVLRLPNPLGDQPCHRKVCPIEGHPCMRDLAVARVFEVVEGLWNN